MAVLVTACRQAGADPSPFVGCYTPALHPEVTEAHPGVRSWMRLEARADTAAAARGLVAYTVTVGGIATDGLGWSWTGWWRPLRADSVELTWSGGTFAREYRLGLTANRLEGRELVSIDSDPEPAERGSASTTRQEPEHAPLARRPRKPGD